MGDRHPPPGRARPSAQVHERGIVYGDLHLFNIVVREDDTVALLDFEVTSSVEEATRPGLNNPGFAPPRDVHGFDIDNYALACLKFALFLPMTNLLGLHRLKARHFAEIITEHFPVTMEFLAAARWTSSCRPAPPSCRTRASKPIPTRGPRCATTWSGRSCASATPDRDDRLFPGDPQQFAARRPRSRLRRGGGAVRAGGHRRRPVPGVRAVAAPARRPTRPAAAGSASTTGCTAPRSRWPTSVTGRRRSTSSTSASGRTGRRWATT